MSRTPNEAEGVDLGAELRKRNRIVLGELRERSLWFIRLRWWVPPGIVIGTALARLAGVDFAAGPTLAAAVFILAYNVALLFCRPHPRDGAEGEPQALARFTYWQVGLDYAAMFLLIHFTGGAASPFIFFFIFHIIFASILLPPISAYGFAALAAGGMFLIAAAEHHGLLPHRALVFGGRVVDPFQEPFHTVAQLAFFATSVFVTAFATTSIMRMLRKGIVDLAGLSEALNVLNSRLRALYAVTQAIGFERNLEKVLDIVTRELTTVMDIRATSIKLLNENGERLRYAAAYGLPADFAGQKMVEVVRSPFNQQVIAGEPYVTGRLTQHEMFQFGEDLAAAGIQSVLFMPLTVKERVTGILGAYCVQPERFGEQDMQFLRLAAGLVGIALENAEAYEAIERLVQERSRFMIRVAHNLRAPLAATHSMLEVVREGHLGLLDPGQAEYLRRVDVRCGIMLSMINELMDLAMSRTGRMEIEKKPLDVEWVAGRLQRTFQDEAARKKLDFRVTAPRELPPIWGDADTVERAFENLVSNAVKYTPAGGEVSVEFSRGGEDTIAVEVRDTGIGIPRDSLPQLFADFYRAPNAKEVEEIGTGLGLSYAKEIVELHGGDIRVDSEEGRGTIFSLRLPAWRGQAGPDSAESSS